MVLSKLVNIDPTGNLIIISEVPGGPVSIQFRVSSKALSLASPLFASLFPDPASHAGKYIITCHGDLPETLGTLFELCHFKRTSPLPYASLRVLYALAVLSEKYAITAPLIPWITIWAGPVRALDELDFGKGDHLRQWLKIACVYDQGLLFQRITRRAILTGSVESLDTSILQGSPDYEILEKIAPERIHALSKLTAIALTLLDRYQTMESICKQPTNSKQCDAILLGSVLKGLMGLGVYQPIPAAPYPGMTVMNFVKKIQAFPLMWDSTHGEECSIGIKEEMSNIMGLVNEILSEIKGLDLGDFKTKKGAGQAKGLVVTAVGDLGNIQQQCSEQEQGSEDGDEIEVEAQAEDKSLADVTVTDIESITSVMTEMPAGVMDGFLETKETMEDFGPRKLFDDGIADETATKDPGDSGREGEREGEGEVVEVEVEAKKEGGDKEDVREKEDGEDKSEKEDEGYEKEKEYKETKTAEGNLLEDGGARRPQAIETVTSDRQKEQLRPTAQVFIPSSSSGPSTPGPSRWDSFGGRLRLAAEDRARSAPRGPPPPEPSKLDLPGIRKEVTIPAKSAPTQHILARANAEAKGLSWEAPGPELVQKYQRGPRFPFHPEVTVGDVSDTENTTKIKYLKEIFPRVDNKILVEFLRQNEWNSEDAVLVLSSGGVPIGDSEDGEGSVAAGLPALEPTALSSPQPIIDPPQGSSQEPTTTTTTNRKPSSSNSAVKTVPHQRPTDVPRKASKTHTRKETISVSRIILGASSSGAADLDPRFWPPADNAMVLRAVKLPENVSAIKKLLGKFPTARADKGFVDVLYRCGWDTEKAARKLEELGFVKEESGSGGDSGDGGKPKSKPKAKSKVKVKAKVKASEGGK